MSLPVKHTPSPRPTAEARRKARAAAEDRIATIAEFIDDPDNKVSDRIRAWEGLAKVGIGAAKDVSVENVQARLAQTLAILREELDHDTLERVVARLQPLWI